MSSLNKTEDFVRRVNYAVRVISEGRRTSRAFDSCFEEGDGDEVAAALVKRARKNEKLHANLFKYIDKQSATEAYERTILVNNQPKEEAMPYHYTLDRIGPDLRGCGTQEQITIRKPDGRQMAVIQFWENTVCDQGVATEEARADATLIVDALNHHARQTPTATK